MKKEKVLILGAGPAGLAAAYQLLKTSKKYEVIILEKEKQIGGLCKTIPFKKNYVDYGVHFYRISEYEEVNKLIYQLLPIEDKKPLDNKKEINQYIRVGKNRFNSHDIMLINQASSNIYFNHQFYEYPIKMNIDTIHKMGIFNLFLIGCSYLKVLVHKKKETNLENYYINRYGKKFYEIFFLEYTKKVCGLHPKDIDIDWGKQRIRETSLMNLLKEKLFKKKKINHEPSLIEEYYYPKYGCKEVYQKMKEQIIELGGKIVTNSYVKNIKIENNQIKNIEYNENGQKKNMKTDYLISSIPLKEFVTLLEDNQKDEKIIKYAKELPFRDLMLVHLTFSKKQFMKLGAFRTIQQNSWVFIQDPKIQFGRIKIANNWSSYMLDQEGKNQILLTLEYCCDRKSPFFKLKNDEVMKEVKRELKQLKLMPNKGIIDYKINRVKNAYPAYYGTYEKRKEIIEYLNRYHQIYCIGRGGQHQYIDMDKAMYTGLKASDSIIKSKKSKKDIWLS